MNISEYKKYHESFMQNNHGSTALHTFMCIFFTVQCTLLCAIKHRNLIRVQYIYEYLVIVLPLIIAHTVLADYVYGLNIAVCLLLLYELSKNYSSFEIYKTIKSENVFPKGRIHSITCLRGLTYLITGLCILAVDFKDFPRHLAKTEKFGYSLMDTGVGLFVLMSGLVHKEVNKQNIHLVVKSNIKFITILTVLGAARFISVKQLDYQEHVTEYGVHWNFFFTLAICKLITSILLTVSNQPFLFCILSIIVHEILLYGGLQSWVFSEAPRNNFIDANREGITSSLGYVSLYLFAANLKKELSNQSVQRCYILKKLFYYSVVLNSCSFIINKYRPTSRTLANAGYCMYLTSMLIFVIGLIYFLEILFQGKKMTNFNVPFILTEINNNGLIFFLVANLTTGLVNMTFRTLLLPSFVTFIILNIYMMFTVFATIFLNSKGIRL